MTSQSEPSSPNARPNRRRQYLVDKPFQYRLIFVLLAIWGVNSVFSSVILYYFYETYVQYFYHLLHWEAIASVRFQTTIGFITVFGLGLVAVFGAYPR